MHPARVPALLLVHCSEFEERHPSAYVRLVAELGDSLARDAACSRSPALRAGAARLRRRPARRRRSRTPATAPTMNVTALPKPTALPPIQMKSPKKSAHRNEMIPWSKAGRRRCIAAPILPNVRTRLGPKKFTEPVALLSTFPVNLRLPPTALGSGFDLLALRARCKREGRRPASRRARGAESVLPAICENFCKRRPK